MPGLKTLALALAAVSLAACNNAQGTGGVASNGGGNRLCTPFATTPATAPGQTATPAQGAPATAPSLAPAAGTDPAAALDDCLHRWGYALAASRDDANQVATATVAACGPNLSRWNQQSLASEGGGGSPEAPSLLTGQPTTPITEHYIFGQGRALFYVVQARAGKCAAPPMTNGVPTGVAAD
jgi:predicted small secreted protein